MQSSIILGHLRALLIGLNVFFGTRPPKIEPFLGQLLFLENHNL